jgi:peroxiredoxin
MKKLILFCMLAFFTGSVMAQNMQSVPVNTQAPAMATKMKDVSGKQVTIQQAAGKNGVLVMFSCNTCPYVIKNEARTKEVAAFAVKNGYGVIIINSNEAQRGEEDSFDAMKAYAKKLGYTWYYAVDSSAAVANAFGATRTPEVFLMDASGKIIYKGAIDDSPGDATKVTRQHLKEAITESAAGKAVTVKESRSIGCTIKRS